MPAENTDGSFDMKLNDEASYVYYSNSQVISVIPNVGDSLIHPNNPEYHDMKRPRRTTEKPTGGTTSSQPFEKGTRALKKSKTDRARHPDVQPKKRARR